MIKNILLAILLLPVVCVLVIVLAGVIGVTAFYLIEYSFVAAGLFLVAWLIYEYLKKE